MPTNVPVGQPLPGVDARDRGPRTAALLEGTGTGELLVWTPFQTRGYLNDRAERGAGSSPAPTTARASGRYYRTGDIVRRHDDGSLTLEGRTDFYVKVRGVRVSTQVVEQAIQEHPDVVEVAVVAVPDELAGTRLHAVLRPRARQQAQQPDAAASTASSRLARTEMPSTIEIVTEPLPKTSTGKIDREDVVAGRARGG